MVELREYSTWGLIIVIGIRCFDVFGLNTHGVGDLMRCMDCTFVVVRLKQGLTINWE